MIIIKCLCKCSAWQALDLEQIWSNVFAWRHCSLFKLFFLAQCYQLRYEELQIFLDPISWPKEVKSLNVPKCMFETGKNHNTTKRITQQGGNKQSVSPLGCSTKLRTVLCKEHFSLSFNFTFRGGDQNANHYL